MSTLEAAQAGDQTAFESLVGPFRGELHAHCYRMLGSLHDAEDAMQEALLRAWRGLERFEGRSSPRSWLYTIAPNPCPPRLARPPPPPATAASPRVGGGSGRSITPRRPIRTTLRASPSSSPSGSSHTR